MRQGSNSGRRPRGRTNRKQHGGGGGGGGGQPGTRTFDSNGPDGRVRGNARQVYEKYLTLARDATSAGDRIAAEAYYQHAEHYFRILSDSTDPTPSGRRPDDRQPQHFAHQDEGYYGGDEDDDQPVNGHGGRPQRPYDARGNGNQPQQRDHEPRDPQRQPQQRQPQQRDTQQRDPESREAPRQAQPAPVEAAPAVAEPAVESRPQPAPAAGEGEAPRPRRGRPRKPRPSEDGEAGSAESSSETESGPVS